MLTLFRIGITLIDVALAVALYIWASRLRKAARRLRAEADRFERAADDLEGWYLELMKETKQ